MTVLERIEHCIRSNEIAVIHGLDFVGRCASSRTGALWAQVDDSARVVEGISARNACPEKGQTK